MFSFLLLQAVTLPIITVMRPDSPLLVISHRHEHTDAILTGHPELHPIRVIMMIDKLGVGCYMVGPGGHSGAQTRIESILPEKDLQPRTSQVRLADSESNSD
jgi:hypothetical protein